MDPTKYFATLSGKEFSSAVFEKIEQYYSYLKISGRLNLYKRLSDYYYSGRINGGRLNAGGGQNEFTLMGVNHFRNVLQHMHTMTTTQRPAFEPRSTNTDYKSKAQTIVARGVLDYYNREKGMGENAEDVTETGLVFGESESVVEWDAFAGKDYMAPPDGKGVPIKSGDITFKEFGPIDCIRDVSLTQAKKMTWRVYRSFENKFDLAARFPEVSDRILKLSVDLSTMENRCISEWKNREGDTVPLYLFYHDKTPSCPQGRYALIIDSDAPLIDSGLPYDTFPGYRLAAAEEKGTAFGYSLSFDLLPIQEAIDLLYSTVVTNQSNFGVQNIAIPEGSNISVKQLVDGLNAIYFNSKFGKPEPLNLTNTPVEIFNFIVRLEGLMETLSGINSVTRGNPEASLKSGSALALVQSMAIQFNSGLAKAYARQVENIGTAVVKILAKFPKTKRIIEISGKANRTYLKEFSSEDLAGISHVTVDLGNPLSRTTAGKVQMAEDLLANKMIESRDQYIQVLTTGQLEPLIEAKQAELMLIASENEMLGEGKLPSVAVTDDHALHIRENKVVLSSPEARRNPVVVKAVTEHLTEHIKMLEQLSQSNPNLLVALGQTPVPPPVSGGGAPGGRSSELMDVTSPATKEASKINQPNMPTNPMTGDKAPPPIPVTAV